VHIAKVWSFDMNGQLSLEERNFSVTEAAQYLRVSRSYLYKLFATGSLRPVKLGTRTIVRGDELKRFMIHVAVKQ
jgi:excisionase family DNA binding protein